MANVNEPSVVVHGVNYLECAHPRNAKATRSGECFAMESVRIVGNLFNAVGNAVART
jgi:hypothetical protein